MALARVSRSIRLGVRQYFVPKRAAPSRLLRTVRRHGTDGEDGERAITRNVAQPVCEVALPLAAKTGNAMRRNGLQQIGGKIEALQEFQTIEKAVDVGRVPAHLEPAQPDEPAHAAVHFLGKQLG